MKRPSFEHINKPVYRTQLYFDTVLIAKVYINYLHRYKN